MFSGQAGSTTLSSQRGALDQGTGMTGMATAADNEELLVIQYLKLKGDNKPISTITNSAI